MEYEGDEVKTLESRLAQIEEWKRCKDDAEYRAKVKAENEYWEAVEKLEEYRKRIEDICVLATKLASYKIYFGPYSPGGCVLVCLHPNAVSGNYEYYFGKIVYDKYGANVDHYVLSNGSDFHYCTKNSDSVFRTSERHKPETKVLLDIYNGFPEFEKQFYIWLDEKTKI